MAKGYDLIQACQTIVGLHFCGYREVKGMPKKAKCESISVCLVKVYNDH